MRKTARKHKNPGHTSLPITIEKDKANLTNPAMKKQSSPESPLIKSEGQNTPTATAGGSAEAEDNKSNQQVRENRASKHL
jgi:hypothetical protein